MGQKQNNHFVPQHHFRRFTGGKRYINVASRDASRFAHGAGIRHQCARHKFYGNQQVEEWLAELESRHAAVYRAVIDIARSKRTTPLSDDENHCLLEAILLQRIRTPRSAHGMASLMNQMMLYAYCKHLKSLPTTSHRKAVIEAIQHGKATIRNSQSLSLEFSLSLIPHAVIAISDLALLILRNHSTAPFIVGDAPCIFSNHYMRTIQNSGVLGFMSPGLMIALPLDTRTLVLLYDASVYAPDYANSGCVDVFQRADVSLLNALQVHAAEENVYFADRNDRTYVHDLLSAHKRHLQHHTGRFIPHNSNTETILQIFEAQLPITLDLSFISTAPLSPSESPNRQRSSELAQQFEHGTGRQRMNSRLDMGDLASLLESEIEIRT